jgi:hypothetical protein
LKNLLVGNVGGYKKMNESKKRDDADYEMLLGIDSETDNYQIYNVAELMKKKIEPLKFIIDNLIVEGGLIYIGALPKAYKSFIATLMAVVISLGIPFLGYPQFFTTKKNVLYIDEENGLNRIIRRISQILKGLKIKSRIKNLYVISKQNCKLDEESIYKIKRIIKTYNIDVLFLDSLIRFIDGDEDKASDMRRSYDIIKKIQKDTNVTVIALHHIKKSAESKNKISMYDLRGSSEFSAMADAILGLTKKKDGVVLQIVDSRDMDTAGKSWFVNVNFSEKEGVIFECKGEKEVMATENSKFLQAFNLILDFLKNENKMEFKTREIRNYVLGKGYTKDAFNKALKYTIKKGFLDKKCHGVYNCNRNLLPKSNGKLEDNLDNRKNV